MVHLFEHNLHEIAGNPRYQSTLNVKRISAIDFESWYWNGLRLWIDICSAERRQVFGQIWFMEHNIILLSGSRLSGLSGNFFYIVVLDPKILRTVWKITRLMMCYGMCFLIQVTISGRLRYRCIGLSSQSFSQNNHVKLPSLNIQGSCRIGPNSDLLDHENLASFQQNWGYCEYVIIRLAFVRQDVEIQPVYLSTLIFGRLRRLLDVAT